MNKLEKLLLAGGHRLRAMDEKELAALKLGLVSMGTLMGLGLSRKKKKAAVGKLLAGAWVPLMGEIVNGQSRTERPE